MKIIETDNFHSEIKKLLNGKTKQENITPLNIYTFEHLHL